MSGTACGGAAVCEGDRAVPRSRLAGTPLLLLLDIDGTLCDLVPHADAARVPRSTCDVLERLAARPDVRVALVTGRAVADAVRIAPVRGAHVFGNHGIEWRTPDGTAGVHPAWDAHAAALRRAARELTAALSGLERVWLEDKQHSLTVHVRGAARNDVPAVREVVRATAGRLGLRVTGGKEVLNVVPAIDADKGTAALQLVGELGGDRPGASVLFAGDDVTDEDAFRALRSRVPHAVTVHVGPADAPTAAEYRVASPAALAGLLERIEAARP